VSAIGWIVAVTSGILVTVLLTDVVSAVRGRVARERSLIRAGARRLRGRLDPTSEHSFAPALLVELDGRLLRAVGWPAASRASATEPSPYLEICTPLEGSSSPVIALRRTEAPRLLPLLGDEARRLPSWEPSGAVCVLGHHSAMWTGKLFERHASWALLELDGGLLRVLTTDPQRDSFDGAAIEHAVRGFAAAVPTILLAAGLTNSSARRGQN
jgi:hypothetical protein